MDQRETAQFRASAGTLQGFGTTPQKALHQCLKRLPAEVPAPIVIWPYNRGDVYFTDAQHARLQELKACRDTLSDTEREELERLVEQEFNATVARTRTLARIPKFHRGDHVIFDFGMRPVTGEVIEDRGTIGVGGRRLFSVRFPFDEGVDAIIELPEEELESA